MSGPEPQAREASEGTAAPRPLPLWLVLGAPALTFLVATGLNCGGQMLTGPDEPRYAAVAREMLRTGDWIVPRYNGEPWLRRPVLLYWGCAAFSMLLGMGAWACRLPSVLAGLGTVMVTAGLGARLYGRRAGLLAGTLLATCWLFVQVGRAVSCDMPLTFFVVAGIALLRLALDEKRAGRRRLLLLAAYVCAGLGVLAKGPLGLLLPLGVMAAWLAWEDRPLAFFRLLPLAGTVVALLVAAPWYLAARLGSPGAAGGVAGFPGHDNYDRFFHGFDHSGGWPWRYLTTSVPQGMVPWTFLLPAALLAFWTLARRKTRPGLLSEHTPLCFPLLWAGAVIGFFSAAGRHGLWPWVALAGFLGVSYVVLFLLGRERHWRWVGLAVFCLFAAVVGWSGGTRRPSDILSAFPPLAIVAGWALDRLAERGEKVPWARRLAEAVPAALGLVLLVIAGVAVVELLLPGRSLLSAPVPNIAEYRAQPGYAALMVLLTAACVWTGVRSLVFSLRGRLTAAVFAAAVGVAALEGCCWGGAIPLRDRVGEVGAVYASAAPRMADRGAPVLACDVPALAEAVYYLDRPVQKLREGRRGLTAALREKKPRYLVISARRWVRDRDLLASRAQRILRGRRRREEFLVLALDGAAVGPEVSTN